MKTQARKRGVCEIILMMFGYVVFPFTIILSMYVNKEMFAGITFLLELMTLALLEAYKDV